MRFVALLAMAAGGGCAALIYEVVWLQLLQLVIGSTSVSLGVLLATFMGGMCIGSLALPRLVSPQRHPLRVYAVLELGIGILGIGVLASIPLIDRLYVAGITLGLPSMLLRVVVVALCVLPPTILMGATLPALARWTKTTPDGISRLGYLYSVNIAGGVAGCLFAAFYLLRVHDTAVATLFAAALNAMVAIGGFALARRAPQLAERDLEVARRPGGRPHIVVAIALSGFCALGAEVVWTRLLSLMLGATVYTFALILAGFLLGLGIGGSAGGALSRRTARPGFALACCQLLLTVAVAGAAWTLAKWLPYWQVGNEFSAHPWQTFASDFVRCLAAVFPAALLWGASLPLALAAAARPGDEPARITARIYAANTVGAIAGALAFSLLLIPGLGTHWSQRLLIALPAVAAVVAARRWLPVAAPVAIFFAWTAPAVPWEVIGFGRGLTSAMPGKLLYLGEGRNSSIAITDLYGIRRFHVSGKVEASSVQQDMRVQRMLGHLPALFHPRPRSALVVGCGAGVTAGSFVLHPAMERIVLCELEPLIPPTAERFFGTQNNHFLRDRRTRVVFDDARHHVLTTTEKFDIITSDPIHPWVKGSAALYTREYFEMCKRRLNPGGIVTQWVPLYESSLETVKSEIATFFEVFPDGTIWANETAFEEGYDVVLLGGVSAINVEAFERRLLREDHAPILRSLAELGFTQPRHLLGTYAGRRRDLEGWLKGAAINRDRNLRLQYIAGMTPDLRGSFFIYEEMSKYRRFPEELFLGGGESVKMLRSVLAPR